MQHIIIGYGYCGFYLAQALLEKEQDVFAISRHYESPFFLKDLKHFSGDILDIELNRFSSRDCIIYYLIPPTASGVEDYLLQHFLQKLSLKIRKFIYFGSSAVYGDHQGQWVDELAMCKILSDRQRRRLDAEQRIMRWGEVNNITSVLLRIAGIYGPNRLPLVAAEAQQPILNPTEAPFINHIFVKDLALIARELARGHYQGVYNIADGDPQKMGYLQQMVASQLDLKPAPFCSWQESWQSASEMKKEFLQSSKRLSIEKLKSTLDYPLMLTAMRSGVAQSLKGN